PAVEVASSAARDGGLIDIKTTSENRIPAAATAVRTITDRPVVSGATFLENEQTYTRRYDFALAQNLHGSADIVISVQDKDATSNLGRPSRQGITVTVNAPNNGVDEEDQVFSYNATADGITLDTLTEDAGALNLTGNYSGSIPVVISINPVGLNQGGIQDQTLGNQSLIAWTAAKNSEVPDNALQNGLDKDFITDVSSDAFTYVQHDWGVQIIEAQFFVNEPRGFGGSSSIRRRYNQDFPVVVAEVNDMTSVARDTTQLNGFVTADFTQTGTNTVDSGKLVSNRADNKLVFQDNDLLFDTLEKVLGSEVTVTSATPANLAGTAAATINLALVGGTNDNNYPLMLGDAGTATAQGSGAFAQTSINYNLDVQGQAGLDALIANTPLLFSLSFDFDVDNADMTNGASVEFADTRNTATIDTPFADATIVESYDGVVSGLIMNFTDADLSSDGRDINADIRDDYSLRISGNLLEVASITKISTTQGRVTLRTKMESQDADVNPSGHIILWALTDRSGASGNAEELDEGMFTLVVTRFDDPAVGTPGKDLVTFNVPTNLDDLGLNLNTAAGADRTFPITLSFDDPDFLETPPASLESATYTGVEFSFTHPSVVSDIAGTMNTLCTLDGITAPLLTAANPSSYIGESITRTGNLGITGDVALTFASIKQASAACGAIPIGSNLTGFEVMGIIVDTDSDPTIGTTTFPTVSTTPPAYVIQGYRSEAHSLEIDAPAMGNDYIVNINSVLNINLTITDGDPDDGTPASPDFNQSPNIIRTGDTASAWPVKLNLDTTACDNLLDISVGNYVFSTNNQSTANIAVKLKAGVISGPSCTFSILEQGEDGDFIGPVDINIATNLMLSDTDASADADGDGIIDLYDTSPNKFGVMGSGTPTDPYMIFNIFQLQAIAGVDHLGITLDSSAATGNKYIYGDTQQEQLAAHYQLGNDIDANSISGNNVLFNFTPIGDCGSDNSCIAGSQDENPFTGSFHGKGYVITNLFIDRDRGDEGELLQPIGLFGQLGGDARITGVGLSNATLSGWYVTGALVGLMDSGTISQSYVVNSQVELQTIMNEEIGGYSGGAMVGLVHSGVIKYSYSSDTSVTWAENSEAADGFDSSKDLSLGGMVGSMRGGAMAGVYSVNNPIILGQQHNALNIFTGGLAGTLEGTGTGAGERADIEGSYSVPNLNKGSNNFFGGGLVGRALGNYKLLDSYWVATGIAQTGISSTDTLRQELSKDFVQACSDLDCVVTDSSGNGDFLQNTIVFPALAWGGSIYSNDLQRVNWVFPENNYPSLLVTDADG
ncbi:MAG: hypothetical protein K0U41_09550, partial [Gammaproteobacteria bacterium]|nr:hypothetical protein [Gammaproteobacteria bacterium]